MTEKEIEKVMSDLRNEVQEQNHPIHIGKIVQVAKTADYIKSKARVFLIEFNGATVFLDERNADEELTKLKKITDIVGKEVQFKVLFIHKQTRQIYVTNKLGNGSFDALMEKQKILTGKILEVHDDHILVDHYGSQIIIPKEEYYYMNYEFEQKDVDKKITFVITKIENNVVYGSRRIAMEVDRERVLDILRNGEVIEATVYAVKEFGLRLTYEGHTLILRDKDFSVDFTKTRNVYKVGDKIKVRLNEISYTKRIFVEPLEKYNANVSVDVASKYEVDEHYIGRVVTITTREIFVNLEPGVDILCPIPTEFREPYIGEEVMVKIHRIIKEKNKARGHIVSIINKQTENKEFVVVNEESEGK